MFRFIAQSFGIPLTWLSASAAIRAFSSTRSSDRLNASHGLGHESFGDILAAAWLGQLPPVQLLLGITNKGTEFAENRPTAFQPLRRRVARLMCVRCATSTSVRNCVLILIEPSFCFPLLPSIRFSFLQDYSNQSAQTLLQPRSPTTFSPECTARLFLARYEQSPGACSAVNICIYATLFHAYSPSPRSTAARTKNNIELRPYM